MAMLAMLASDRMSYMTSA